MKAIALMWAAFSVMAWASGVPWYFAPVTGAATVFVLWFFYRVEEERDKQKHGGTNE